ncbi:MAG: thermonuclease family protein [Gammaproteobacteria bacterium]|nr:thermonuclease family protein [Gammaproteobacteria bacterium]
MTDFNLYYYQAKVRSVYDGDTIRADLDLGMNMLLTNEPLRLHRINCPELRGDEREQGLISRDYLRSRISDKTIFINTVKDKKGKYGRYIAEIWLEENGDLTNINDEMVSQGYAAYKDY